jgi:hypothetical protein
MDEVREDRAIVVAVCCGYEPLAASFWIARPILSAWMARAHSPTTFSFNVCGEASNTRRYLRAYESGR